MSLLALILFIASQVGTPGPANMALMVTGAGFGLRRALPFVAGVVVGKQLIVWPIGFGLMELAGQAPWAFAALKYAAAGYIIYLAWRVAQLRLSPGQGGAQVPGFVAGLIVHPLNPKAWAMITGAFTAFVPAGMPAFQATLTVALVLAGCQIILHPIWTYAGEAIARHLAGKPGEKYLMWVLAGLTVLSVLYALWGGAQP